MGTKILPVTKLNRVKQLDLSCSCKGNKEAAGLIRQEVIKWVNFLIYNQDNPALSRRDRLNDDGVIKWNVMFWDLKDSELL